MAVYQLAQLSLFPFRPLSVNPLLSPIKRGLRGVCFLKTLFLFAGLISTNSSTASYTKNMGRGSKPLPKEGWK